MARYSDDELRRIKESVDLAALIRSKGIQLDKHGKDLKGLCPFHADTSPSLVVTPAKNLYRCVSCGEGGDVIQFVMKHDGLSFRHAVELLRDDPTTAMGGDRCRQSTVPKLPPPVELDADDQAQLNSIADYYHERLKETEPAKEYLKKRGIFSDEIIERFKLGYADRTLGLRLPHKNRQAGKALRTQLQKIGILRQKTGHEHLNGCLVVPVHGADGSVQELYGRKLKDQTRCVSHLYLPGPHRGVWNLDGLEDEVVLCESLIDALTCWSCGVRSVTAAFGCHGLTDEIVDALVARRVKRVRIAFDADDAGDKGADSAAAKFAAKGIEVYRVRFPRSQDLNDFIRQRNGSAGDDLRRLIASAEWLADSAKSAKAKPCPESADSAKAEPCPEPKAADSATCAGTLKEAACKLLTPSRANSAEPEATEKKSEPQLEQVGEYWFLQLGQRSYRVGGLEKNNSVDSLRITLRIRHGEDFHLDSLDLAQDNHRRKFVERAAEETGLEPILIKRDVGRLLLKLEELQHERLTEKVESVDDDRVELTEQEHAEAMAFLQSPNLVSRIDEAFDTCGLVGEKANRLAAYLACTSRKLDRPLAIIIQSTSAAGKSTLMDAVLAMFPSEERVQYSAMTGQSLYYLGETNLKHNILAISEEEGAEKASYALKLLQSEGELTIASTGKDPKTGRMETQEYRVEGPVMIFLTTTAIDVDEELQNRCLTLSVDESAEQTKLIHQLQRKSRTLEGLQLKKQKKRMLALLTNVQRLLDPVDVVNPYADQLTFTAGRTRTRRDHEKYLTLIDAIALLHQHQRPKETLPGDDQPFIRVTVDDVALANRLAPELLGRSLEDLPPQPRRMLDGIKALVRERATEEEADFDTILFSRRDVRLRLGWSTTQTKMHLDRLVEHECIAPRRGSFGQTFIYQLLIDPETSDLATIGLLNVEKLRLQRQPDGLREQPDAPLTGTCRPSTRQVV